jgi:hypothetical protein
MALEVIRVLCMFPSLMSTRRRASSEVKLQRVDQGISIKVQSLLTSTAVTNTWKQI